MLNADLIGGNLYSFLDKFRRKFRFDKMRQVLWSGLWGICLVALVSCDSMQEQVNYYRNQLMDRWNSFEFKKIKRPPQRRFYAGEDQMQMLLIAVGFSVALVLLAYFYSRYWEQHSLRKKEIKKALAKLEKLYTQLQITEEDEDLLGRLMGSFDPVTVLKLIESAEEFEERVEDYKKEHQDERTLLHIYHLRHKLGFSFYNRHIPFLCTQMLVASEKLECVIELPKKNVSFVSPIITATEKFLLIKPPTVKKKPVNLKRFSHLTCKISRSDDAEYQFISPILRQISGEINAIALGHTNAIEKRFLRQAERVAVDIPKTFHAISERHMFLYADQPSLPTIEDIPHFKGRIIDLSSGGAKIVTNRLPPHFPNDPLLLFTLEEANIHGDMTARILDVENQESGHYLHLQFFRLREIKRMRLNKFMTSIKNR